MICGTLFAQFRRRDLEFDRWFRTHAVLDSDSGALLVVWLTGELDDGEVRSWTGGGGGGNGG
jgi:hypothetical protein